MKTFSTYILSLLAIVLIHACSFRPYVVTPFGMERVETSPPSKSAIKESKKNIDFQVASQHDIQSDTDKLLVVDEIDPDNIPIDDISTVELTSSFIGNETEHIKFSRYNPFANGSSFEINLDGLEYCYPIEGKFSSGYGSRGRSMHSGVDLIAAAGTPIHAVFDGVVRLSKPYSGYGNVIVVRHANGLETVYSHNSKNLVRVGQNVKMGEEIALCGRTGRATTNHLHFEVRVQGTTINPTLLLNVAQKTLQSGTLRVSRSSKGALTASISKDDSKIMASKVGDEQDDDIIMQKEKPKVNSSQGLRVGDQLYEAPKASPKAISTDPTPIYHTIAKGQTLSRVAVKYSTSVKKICALNNIPYDRADRVAAGKKIRVK